MEYPGFRNHDRGQVAPEEDGRVRRSYAPEVSRLTGLFLSRGEKIPGRRLPRSIAKAIVEAVVKPADSQTKGPGEVQYSAWHRIEKDAEGNVKSLAEQGYGQAMQLEVGAEQGALGTATQLPAHHLHGAATAAVVGAVVQTPTQASAPRSDADDVVRTTISPVRTPAPYGSLSRPHMPVFDPEHTLQAGPLTQDPEHMIEAPHHSLVARVLKSPWTWLAVGTLLIFYFM